MSNSIKVQVFENQRLGLHKTPKSWAFTKVKVYQAEFCQWGSDFEEHDGGFASYSTAIVKKDDGTVEMPRADYIQFIG